MKNRRRTGGGVAPCLSSQTVAKTLHSPHWVVLHRVLFLSLVLLRLAHAKGPYCAGPWVPQHPLFVLITCLVILLLESPHLNLVSSILFPVRILTDRLVPLGLT